MRALADHSHFQIPFNGAVLRNTFGAVDGTQRAADLLMRTKQCVFVYPVRVPLQTRARDCRRVSSFSSPTSRCVGSTLAWCEPQGGARETFKRTTDEKYELFWKDHMGFAKVGPSVCCTDSIASD